jgi:polyribonucleotide nucleotidyltransferase
MEVIERAELDGGSIELASGKLAKQADGACVVRLGETVVLVTACFDKMPNNRGDFLPLTVDYREYTYAAGRVPGGWFKREGRPTEKETLTSRQIDRPLRPLFPQGYTHETQIVAGVLSADGAYDADVLALNGASAALMISGCPYDTPIGAVRVGLIDGQFVVNPTHQQRAGAQLDLVVAGSENAVVMVEAGSTGISEAKILDAIDVAHAAIKVIIAAQRRLQARLGKPKPAWTPPPPAWPQAFADAIHDRFYGPLAMALRVRGKLAQYAAIDAIEDAAVASLPEEERAEKGPWAKAIVHEMVREQFRYAVLDKRERLDGRAFDQIRPVSCEVGLLPRTHGSALFTRGETQALVTCTLGTSENIQIIEALEGDSKHRFLLHYNFPPFSVGEVKFLRGPGRREIGHGNLARRALAPAVPKEDKFPYMMRVVSDILESNGSSSMATVCGGTLALMDAGVPIAAPVAGIAMGMVSDGARFAILTDIAGQEDHEGDMDFKVAGTRDGITALQMDIKVAGLSREVMEQALEQARRGRVQLLDTMAAAIAAPRADISQYAPRIVTIYIHPDKIRDIIGPGGKTIRAICEQTGAKINVEDDGRVEIATADGEAADKAVKIIEAITRQPQIGEIFEGTVNRIEPFGAFVEILPNKDGLLHVSEIAWERTREVSDVFKLGDKVTVKIIGIDANDRIKVSRRALLPPPERPEGAEGEAPPAEAGAEGAEHHREHRPHGEHRGDRGPRRSSGDRRGGDRPRGGGRH